MKTDTKGDFLKKYESIVTQCRLNDPIESAKQRYETSIELFKDVDPKSLKIMARLDGRAFGRLTKGLAKPDIRFYNMMREIAKFLLDETNAVFCYCQSDEISLIYNAESFPWCYRTHKFEDHLVKLASVKLDRLLQVMIPEKWSENKVEGFDCRLFACPDTICLEFLKWREEDAIRNSISGYAQSNFSPTELHGKHCGNMIEMLKDKNKDWNDLSIQLKRRSYFQRKRVKKILSFDEIEKLPLLHNARKNPNIEIEHFQCLELINFFSIKNVINSIDMIFNFMDSIISDKYKINYDEMNQ